MFLIAYWLYIDGVDTVIRMAVDYGISIGFKSNDLIAALLLTQFVGFPSAILFGRAASRWHIKRLLYGAIFVYIVVTIWAVFMKSKEEFYLLAVCIGLVQGGVQALSRSYYCRLIPQDQTAEFFGFYNMLGKFAAILGPLLIAAVGLIAKRLLTPPTPAIEQVQAVSHTAARYGIASLIILFVAGGVALYFVDEKKDNL
jgi:UMF1 family MFS transporter